MRHTIRLSDLDYLPTPQGRVVQYPEATLAQARAALERRGLRFDNRTGVLRDDNGWLSKPSGYQHEPHETPADVMEWEFRPAILNAASRITRGFQP